MKIEEKNMYETSQIIRDYWKTFLKYKTRLSDICTFGI